MIPGDTRSSVPPDRPPAPADRKGLYEDLALLLLALAILIVPAFLRSRPPGPLRIEGEAARPVLIDVNRAPWHEWMLLEGIGEARARSIVAYREAHGPFLSLDDLKKVPGVPAGLLEKARPHLTLGAPPR